MHLIGVGSSLIRTQIGHMATDEDLNSCIPSVLTTRVSILECNSAEKALCLCPSWISVIKPESEVVRATTMFQVLGSTCQFIINTVTIILAKYTFQSGLQLWSKRNSHKLCPAGIANAMLSFGKELMAYVTVILGVVNW